MRILSIAAQNYRTLQKTDIRFSESYCTISGRNNAGKSCLIRLLQILFRKLPSLPWFEQPYAFDYKEDKTQWDKSDDPIVIVYGLELNRSDDPALLTFIEKIAEASIDEEQTSLHIRYTLAAADDARIEVEVNGRSLEKQAAREIVKKLRDENLMFLYNSTAHHNERYFRLGRAQPFYEIALSEDDRKQLEEAAKQTEKKIKHLAKKNREDLNSILGRLSEKFDVELSPLEGFSQRHMPLGVNLKDKTVELPLSDWGSGTQNRTHILMAVLQANRIKTTESPEDRTTPIVVIEEPESFLHPSAQSEFGRLLRILATEFGIQIITTTHSPFMLNQEDPSSNILLCRKYEDGKSLQSLVVDTSGQDWMAPFAEHLGIDPSEFTGWRHAFSAKKSRVLLVEGPIDKEYFGLLQERSMNLEALDSNIEVVPYGGKDALKNTLLLAFVLQTFHEVFVTYDLDAAGDVKTPLTKLGLKEGEDFLALGLNKPGGKAVEGLLPKRVLDAVNGRETDLVMALTSADSKERRRARDHLKKKYLEEFKRYTDYSKDELKELEKVVKKINSRLGSRAKRGHSARTTGGTCQVTALPEQAR